MIHISTDMNEIALQLRSKPSIRTQDFSEDAKKAFGDHRHSWTRIDEGIILHAAEFTSRARFKFSNNRSGFICFEIALKSDYSRRGVDGRHAKELVLISNSESADYELEQGGRARGIIIYCDRKRFMNKFKLDADRVQERSRSIFLDDHGSLNILKVPLFSFSLVDVDQILNCNLTHPLRTIYLSAKVMEILCTLVAQINEHGAGPRLFSPRGLKVHTIQAAAEIYKRELHNPPTVEKLAERLDIDRRELTKGFKELFGSSPHRYQLQLRMDKAESLLQEGGRSISEVGRLVGYEGYRTFARAYQAYHGRPPAPNSQ